MSCTGVGETEENSDIEFVSTTAANIFKWCEKLIVTGKSNFKLSECKDHFMTIHPKHLKDGCDFLSKSGKVSLDTSSKRIITYTINEDEILSVLDRLQALEEESAKKSTSKQVEKLPTNDVECTFEATATTDCLNALDQPARKKPRTSKPKLNTSISEDVPILNQCRPHKFTTNDIQLPSSPRTCNDRQAIPSALRDVLFKTLLTAFAETGGEVSMEIFKQRAISEHNNGNSNKEAEMEGKSDLSDVEEPSSPADNVAEETENNVNLNNTVLVVKTQCTPALSLSNAHVLWAVRQLAKENKIMVVDDIIYEI